MFLYLCPSQHVFVAVGRMGMGPYLALQTMQSSSMLRYYLTWFGCYLADSFLFFFKFYLNCISSVQLLIVSDSLRPHGLQHARLPCPLPTPRVYSNSCPLSRWCHPTISSSVSPFSSRLQCFPESGSFQMRQCLASGGQRIGISASASVLPMNIQDWFPLGLIG